MLAIDRRSGLAQHLPAALEASEPIERELVVTDQDGQPRTVLVKLAARELLGGRRCVVGVVRDISERKALEHSLEAKIRELEQERTKVKQLQGLLPICMHCGRIRDGGQWEELEAYIESHSDAVFSHGLCQQCMSKHYPRRPDDRRPGPDREGGLGLPARARPEGIGIDPSGRVQ